MIPARFDYARPATLAEAHALLARQTPTADIAVLAGGQSLLTTLKRRHREPDLVLDLGSLEGLQAVHEKRGKLHVGAMLRQADFVEVPYVSKHAPIFRDVAAAAGDPMIRRRGTLVGAFCEVDPAGDWVAAGLVHDAELEISSPKSSRTVSLEALASQPKATRLARGEIVTKAVIPPAPKGTLSAYRKCKHNAIGWSIASVAVIADVKKQSICKNIRLAVSGAPIVPRRLRDLEASLCGVDLSNESETEKIIRSHVEDLECAGDRYASASYRKERLVILIRRTLADIVRTPQQGKTK